MLKAILNEITSSEPFLELIERVNKKQCPARCLKLPRSVRLPLLAAIHQSTNIPILFITEKTDRALTFLDELKLWRPNTMRLLFPEPNALFYENTPWEPTTRRERLAVLTALSAQQIPTTRERDNNPIIITTAKAVMTRTLPKRVFLKHAQMVRINQQIQFDKLVRNLISIGYSTTNLVIEPGQFTRRGGILDIWPPVAKYPIRIEFFGDEIDTIREFDPATQLTIQKIDRIFITPAREFVVNEKASAQFGDEISEFHIPLLYQSEASIIDYLPTKSLIIIEDLEGFQDTVTSIEEQSINLRSEHIAEGLIQDNFPLPYLTWDQIIDNLPQGKTLFINAFGIDSDDENQDLSLSEYFSPNPRFGGQLKPFVQYLRTISKGRNKIFIVSRQSSRLTELWNDNKPYDTDSEPVFIHGSLAEGWIFSPGDNRQIHLLTDGEIFGWRRPIPRKRPRPPTKAPESHFADLKQGDWVVHVDHGIGKFLGLVQREIDNTQREFLCIEYASGDQLFVPVHQADRISRYIGPDNRPPKVTRLGSADWRNAKAKATDAVKHMAEELLDLYARRQETVGFAFSEDTPWQKELEASFPYIETEDQLRVIAEVKRDMERPLPMDRLICGDVGYGKTEIALRAAFKAVMDNKQVAILVPTTVLAQQHYQTFKERLSPFPVIVEMLSRFRTTKEQIAIVKKLAKGSIDIIIGTHRLLSKDIVFKDLGLLIIDEEQRFGVTHKEQLKKLRVEVDVLTMTATPIPRTLYLTLTGIRDISTINTPPEERLPVRTHIGPYDPKVVRKAILRELDRGGQVFFVHNRVQTIQAMREHLRKLVPEAKIRIAHGQMPEHELSKIMEDFTSGEIDVLLSTTIIESGLDIPNANTLIVDRADTFGLSQLYQLRGRVGRGAQRAYAYFFKHKKRLPTPEGRERLETIAENTQLGSGFSIAMRDLEIRGAGDILGTRQHGHIAAVGFHLYTRLLSEAIQRLKKEHKTNIGKTKSSDIFHPIINVDLGINVGIPAAYIPDREVRLGLYRRIADIQSLDEVKTLQAEFEDRFGKVPKPVTNLLYQIKIKILAERANITAITASQDHIILQYPNYLSPPPWIERQPLIRTGKHRIWIARAEISTNWRSFLLELLTELSNQNKY